MVRDRCNYYFSFWTIFCPFTLLTAQKITIRKKMKKRPGDIIISHKCTKNHNHMLNCSWDMMRDRCDCYFSFWAIFLPFYPPNSPKNENLKKKKKYTLRYHNFTYVYQRLWLDDVRFLRYGVRWMDGQTGQTNGRTDSTEKVT